MGRKQGITGLKGPNSSVAINRGKQIKDKDTHEMAQ